jgi:5-methyltetrahydrofolate--homocysteine methyltransferase
MPRMSLKERISEGLFLLDGAMGTQLIARGIEAGACSDYLNIESPDIIFEIHQAYFRAGSDAVLTNTFGANKYALARHGLSDKVKEINTAAAKIARLAAGAGKYVLGDIGPSGDFLQPLGNLEAEELKNAFAEQAKSLSAGGGSTSSPSVDGFIIETMTSLDEATIAVEAVKQASRDLPVFVSFAFDRVAGDFRTMMGVDIKSAVTKMVSLGVDAVGFNCGTVSLDEYIILAERFAELLSNKSDVAVPATAKQTPNINPSTSLRTRLGAKRVLLLAEPNAGKPELVDGRTVYKVLPEDFAAAEKIYSAGVNIIGGCCGTTPEHIRVLAEMLQK